LVAEDLGRGTLVRVCPAWVWKRVELYALVPSREHPRSSVKAFVGALQGRAGRIVGGDEG
jgi:hypothetical protein